MLRNSLTLWSDIAPSKIGLNILSQQSPTMPLGFCARARSQGKASLKMPRVDHASSQYLKIEPFPNLALKNLLTREKICRKPLQNKDAPLVGCAYTWNMLIISPWFAIPPGVFPPSRQPAATHYTTSFSTLVVSPSIAWVGSHLVCPKPLSFVTLLLVSIQTLKRLT